MITDPRIGTPDRRPDVSISGQPYTRPATTRGLSVDGYYVVLDIHSPRGFDVEATIAELESAILPARQPIKKGKPTHNEQASDSE